MKANNRLNLFLLSSTLLLLSACDGTSSSNNGHVLESITTQPLSNGTTANILVNLPDGATTAGIGATLYDDATEANLKGGDIISVTSDDNVVLLYPEADEPEKYFGTIPVVDPRNSLGVEIIHDAEGLRAPRWYPTDLLTIDPGPGDLVGDTGVIEFPETISFESPADQTTYNNRSDDVIITWTPTATDDDQVYVSYSVNCIGQSNPLENGYAFKLDDDGFESFDLDEFLQFTTLAIGALPIVEAVVEVFVDLLLEATTFGLYDRNDVVITKPDVPDLCEIQLFLLRGKDGMLSDTFDGGSLIGLRSDTITIYHPPTSTITTE